MYFAVVVVNPEKLDRILGLLASESVRSRATAV